MAPKLSPRRKWLLLALLGSFVLVAIFQAPLRWAAHGLHRKVFAEQAPERPVDERLAQGPLDLSTFVREARQAWPGASAGVVHAAAFEVARGLLHHADIEVGSMVEGKFMAWPVKPWTAARRIGEQLGAQPGFLSEQGRYVFRRKTP